MEEEAFSFELSYKTNPDTSCPVMFSEREQGSPHCAHYADEDCGCDMNELRVFIPDGCPCHRVYKDKKGNLCVVCIPREIPGLLEAINNSQYFRWAGKIVREQVRLWVQGYYSAFFPKNMN